MKCNLFQQEHVLAELQEYASQEPAPRDAPVVMETVRYLQACHQMFERGILGKKVFVKSMESPILKNMDSGYHYFSHWLDEKLDTGRLKYIFIDPEIKIVIVQLQVIPSLRHQGVPFWLGRHGTCYE